MEVYKIVYRTWKDSNTLPNITNEYLASGNNSLEAVRILRGKLAPKNIEVATITYIGRLA